VGEESAVVTDAAAEVALFEDGNAVRLTIYGVPSQQSGTRIVPTKAGPRGISTGGKNLRPWRQSIAAAARQAVEETGVEVFEVPVTITVSYRFPMPASRPKWMKQAGTIPKWTAPDIDKLDRALFDGLVSGGLLRSDALVQQVLNCKVEVWDQWTGALVDVAPSPMPERGGP
jgi:Holliday junction resolvase RusA-like endonuclease